MSPPEDPIYLDYNATTPLLPEVVDAMLPYLREHFGNPSSGHVYGARASAAIRRARAQVAGLLGCDADEIIFTSGGTEANNLAIRGAAEAQPGRRGVVTTVIEHPATARPCAWLERHGWKVTWVGVDADGRARADEAIAAIDGATALVTVMHANNETGALQPVEALAAAARAAGAAVHSDAAQSAGKVPVKVDALGVDLLSISGHKLYAPKGVGALYVRRGAPLAPFTLGAGHERGLRPGTENVAGIVGLGVAAARAEAELEALGPRLAALRDALWGRLAAEIPKIMLHGHPTLRLPNTLNVRFPRVSGADLLALCPEIAASTGSACHSAEESATAAILAMGVSPGEAVGAMRLTLGRGTTAAEIERAAQALISAWRRLSAESRS
jgi:cysteine desulfurase